MYSCAGARVPPSGEPASDAAPRIAGAVLAAAVDGVEPRLLALVAVPPDVEGDVEVVGGGAQRALDGVAEVRRADLHQADRLRALAAPAVGADRMAGCAVGRVVGPVAEVGLRPVGLLGHLGPQGVLVEAPLAGRPLDDLVRRAREAAGRPGELGGVGTPGRGVVAGVARPHLGAAATHGRGAGGVARQGPADADPAEVGARARRRCRAPGRSSSARTGRRAR